MSYEIQGHRPAQTEWEIQHMTSKKWALDFAKHMWKTGLYNEIRVIDLKTRRHIWMNGRVL